MIDLKLLSFKYKNTEKNAVSEASAFISSGVCTALTGPSGSGKSTLLYLIAGFAPGIFKGARSGSVSVNGHDPAKMSIYERASKIGIVFSDPKTQLSGICSSVREEIAWGPENLGISPEEALQKAQKYAAYMNLTDIMDKDPAFLSAGQQQRLAAASIMAMEPEILLLDDPAKNLDPRGKAELIELIKAYSKDRTVIWSTSKLEEASAFGSWIFMDEGRIIYHGEPSKKALNIWNGRADSPLQTPWARLHKAAAPIISSLKMPLTEAECISGFSEVLKDVKSESAYKNDASKKTSDNSGSFCIDLQNVCTFRRDAACNIKDLNLTLKSPERIFICGSNGSGKTTFARIAAGLTLPSQGRILINKTDGRYIPPFRRASLIGFVFADPRKQIFSASVRDEIAFGPKNQGLSESEIAQRCREAAELTGLSGRLDIHPYDLSSSELSRLAIGSVLAMDTEAIIFDEPAAAADQKLYDMFCGILDYLKQRNKLTITITHDINSAADFADRLLIMEKGQLVFSGSPEEAFKEKNTFPKPLVSRISSGFNLQAAGTEKFLNILRHLKK